MTRPTDWSALGLSSDPTPGDPSQVQDVLNLINDLSSDYTTIIDALNKINGYAASDNFVGKTADELRDQMNNRITNFVTSAYDAFTQASQVMTTYSSAITTHQTTADNLLTQAQNSGLASTDPQIKTWADQATSAGSDLSSAETTAANGIRGLPGPSNPLSPWQEFLQILGWIALLLILPAMIFGGVFAIAAFLVNAILFVNALVEFAKGQLSFGGLLLAALGVIAPSTRAMDLGEIVTAIKGIGSTVKSGLVTVKAGFSDFATFFSTAKLGDVLSLDNLVKLGSFTLKAGVWVLETFKGLPSTMITAGTAFADKLGDLIVAGGAKVFTSLKTGSFLSLILPVDAAEVEALGLGEALRIGFLEHGLGITAPAGHNLSVINKLSFAGLHTGDMEGFSHLDAPHAAALNIGTPKSTIINLPGFSANLKLTTLDAHLEAPQLSIGNLTAAFEHSSLDVGTISVHLPANNFHMQTMEVMDLRNPPELNKIGQGTVITKFDDMSFVTVHEDFAPQSFDANLGATTVPAMHTGTITVPSMHMEVPTSSLHTGNLPGTSLHSGELNLPALNHLSPPTLATTFTHLTDNLNGATPSLHIGNLSLPALHTDGAAGLSSKLPDMQMPNLGEIASTRISTGEFNGASVLHGDTGLKLNGNPDAFTHLTAPVISTPHLAETATTAIGHLETPVLGSTHVNFTENIANVGSAAHLHTTGLSTDAIHLSTPETGALEHLSLSNPSMDLHSNIQIEAPHLALNLSDGPHVDLVPSELKTVQATPEMTVQFSDAGLRTDTLSHLAGPSIETTHLTETTLSSVDHLEAPSVASTHINTTEGLDVGGLAAAAHLHPANFSADVTHLGGTEAGAFEHLALGTPELHPAVPLEAPHLAVTHLGETPRIETVPPELRTLESTPEIGIQISDTGLRTRPNEAEISFDAGELGSGSESLGGATAGLGHSEQLAPVAGHTETSVPAVSSSGLDDALAHSAGQRGEPSLAPDLAGRPGLIDPNGERLAVSWTQFKQAQHDYSDALADHKLQFHEVDPKTGVGMAVDPKGKAPQTEAQGLAEVKLEATAGALHNAAAELHELGTDPAELTALEHIAVAQSLIERPRLLGGARPGDRPLAVDPDTHLPNLTVRPVGPLRQLLIHTGHDGHETGTLTDLVNSDVVFHGSLTEVDGHGGFRLTSLQDGNHFREYLPDGTLHAQGMSLTGREGVQLGSATIDHTGAITVDFTGDRAHPVNAAGNGSWTAHPAADGSGGFRLRPDDPGDSSWRDFDADGRFVGRGFPLTHMDGHPIGDAEFDFSGAPDTHSALITSPDGRVAIHTLDSVNGRMFRVTLQDDSVMGIRDDATHGELLAMTIRPTLRNDDPLDEMRIYFNDRGGAASFPAPGVRSGSWDLTHDAQHSGFTLTNRDSPDTLHFSGDGELTLHEIQPHEPVTGNALNPVNVDHGAGRAVFHAPGMPSQRWRFTLLDQGRGGFTLTSRDGAHTFSFRDDNALAGHVIDPHEVLGGKALNPVSVNHGTGLADFHAPGLANQQWRFAHVGRDGGGFTLTSLDGTRTFYIDGRNALAGHAILPHDPVTGNALNPVLVDARTGLADFHAPGMLDRQWTFSRLDQGDGFALTSIDNTHTLYFDGDNAFTRHVIEPHESGTGNALNPVIVDARTNRADFHAPGLPDQQWNFAHAGQDGDGFTLTSLDDVHTLHFTGTNELGFEHFSTRDPVTGDPNGNFILSDHFAGPGGAARTLVDADGHNLADFRVTEDAAGHFVVTDTHEGQVNGSSITFNRVTGEVRSERINLQDHSGLHVDVDHTFPGDPDPGLHPLNAGGADVTRFDVARDEHTGQIELTDTAAAHLDDTKTFNSSGVKIGEHISITDVKGRPTGQHFTVTLTPGNLRWTRSNAAVGDARLGHGYNGSGAAKIKNDGSLVLEGADKSPFFLRERLTTGQTLEMTRMPDGSRRWNTWDQDGNFTGSGVRHFTNEEGGISSWDVGKWGQTIRQYRTAIDGGTIRAEKLPDGSFTWTRFDKDGNQVLSGLRNRSLGGTLGWKDTYQIGGRSVEVQRNWSAFNFFTHASHYKEHGFSADATTADGFAPKASFKEISQQGKDTGSLEILGNGNKLEFTRYAEQRPPEFLWKSPDNLPPGLSKVLAKSYLGSKYGALDFPNHGFMFGDSRFQVFKWAEHDAHDVKVSGGVRVLTPDGSFSDFAGDGVFVRGAIKLDNGHTVEIGRDGDGKWDTFQLAPGGGRPSPTLNWRDLDGDKNPTASGIRTFTGKQWKDTTTDVPGGPWVVRHTTPTGDVVHFTGSTKPRYDPAQVGDAQIVHDAGGASRVSITRNTIGQIVERTDHWGDAAVGRNVTGLGDPRAGKWRWTDEYGANGTRLSGRNNPMDGSWDDSFADFRAGTNGLQGQIRDFRALDKGTSLKAQREPDPATGGWRWTSAKFDAKGDLVDGSAGFRTWKQADGHFRANPPSFKSPKLTPWRDHDANGNLLRELTGDNKVREYTDAANGTHAWKEYDFGSVWRERQPVSGHPNLFMEKESFQKQWRVTAADGTLLRYRALTGRVWELNTFGKWTVVGTEREEKGLLNNFRGGNRRLREPNRFEYKTADGQVGEFRSDLAKLTQKTLLDVAQDFVIDVAANVIITGATDGWDFKDNQIASFLVGGAIRSGVKGAYGVLSETLLKDFRDGLRNMDSGKDFNRQPYANDKFWDNDWAGNENPTRWRSGSFDFFVGGTLVPAIGSFIATLSTGAAFGFGKEGYVLGGGELFTAASFGLAGNLVGGLSIGAVRTLGHLTFSGRWFHQGGIPDITLTFGEKLLTDYFVNDFLGTYTPLSSGHEAKTLAGIQAQQNQGGAQG